MSNNPDDVLGGITHDEGDAKDAKALDKEFDMICKANAAKLLKELAELAAIHAAKPPSYPPPNYMFATLYRQ